MTHFTAFVLLLAIISIIIQMISWRLKISDSYHKALFCTGIILALALAPIYLYYHIPSEHVVFNLNTEYIFGILSLKNLFLFLWIVWFYAFSTISFLFIYHVTFEDALIAAFLLLIILFLCSLVLILIDLFYIHLTCFNPLG